MRCKRSVPNPQYEVKRLGITTETKPNIVNQIVFFYKM